MRWPNDKGGAPVLPTTYEARQFLVDLAEKPLSELPESCILWPFGESKNGYGNVWYKTRNYNHHRLVMLLRHGPEYIEGAVVRHLCHDRRCANPKHLTAGTPKQNSFDRTVNDLNKTGKPGTAKLFPEDVKRIRELVGDGYSMRSVAKEFGVGPTAVRQIIVGVTWAWLK